MKKRTELNINKIKAEKNDFNHSLDSDNNIANFVINLITIFNNFSNFFGKDYNIDDLTKSQIENCFKKMNFIEKLIRKSYIILNCLV